MKKYLSIFILVAFLLTPLDAKATIYPVSQLNHKLINNSALPNNKEEITVEIYPCYLDPNDEKLYAHGHGIWTLTGSGVSISSPTWAGYPEGGLVKTDCGAGKIYWKVKSLVAGSKNLMAMLSDSPSGDYSKKITVTFTAPPTSSSPTTQAPTTTTTKPKEKTKEKPATPTLIKLVIGGVELTKDDLKEQATFRYEEGVTFSGKTIANGIVYLYFNSEPYETSVTADKDGNWEYTLDRDLGEGEHTLEIAVEDPKTKEISDKSEPYSFTLVAGATTDEPEPFLTEATEETKGSTPWLLISFITMIILGAGIGGTIYYKRKKTVAKN